MMSIFFILAKYLIFFTPFILLYYLYKNKKQEQFKKSLFTNIKKMILVSFSAVLSWVMGSMVIKNILKIERPTTVGEFITPIDPYSFPSGHTTFIVALGVALYAYDKKLGIFTIILGVLVGVSRVLTGVHFYIDILGGLAIGMIFGFLFINIFIRLTKNLI